MNKKTNYIIPTVILCLSFTFFHTLNVLATTPDEEKYLCNKCSLGKCTEYWHTGPCTDTCAGCKTYNCKICSGGSCILKTFDTPCSDACASGDCGGKKCNVCENKQCRIKELGIGCIDQCTGAENCSGDGGEKEKGWKCTCNGGPCFEQFSTSPQYSTLARCELFCPCGTYKYCGTKWPNLGKCAETLWYNVNPGNECETASDCQASEKYTCNANYQCVVDSNGLYTSLTTCQNNCIAPSTRYSCNTSTWTCSQDSHGSYSSLNTCNNNCNNGTTCTNGATQACTTSDNCPGSRTCTNNAWGACVDTPNDNCPGCTNGATQACTTSDNCPGTKTCTNNAWGACVDTPNDNCPPLPCQINSFTINEKNNSEQDPLIVWVNASLRGYFSVLNTCTKCTVSSNDTWGNPDETYIMTNYAPEYEVSEQFKISQAGTYSYKLICIGDPDNPDDFDEDILSLETVQAVNLPWWREIIPNLGGFLRGL
jgi:hypothetical protein